MRLYCSSSLWGLSWRKMGPKKITQTLKKWYCILTSVSRKYGRSDKIYDRFWALHLRYKKNPSDSSWVSFKTDDWEKLLKVASDYFHCMCWQLLLLDSSTNNCATLMTMIECLWFQVIGECFGLSLAGNKTPVVSWIGLICRNTNLLSSSSICILFSDSVLLRNLFYCDIVKYLLLCRQCSLF